MLRFLRIRNLAVIAAADVEFDAGLNVLTGETGAGKSILVEAVGLLLGHRAAGDLVRTGETHAAIEAVFERPEEGELIIRREITSQGRSRAFVDGTLATTAALRALSQQLVELHGQHDHQTLLDPLAHLPLLDDYAGLDPRVQDVAATWERLRLLRRQLDHSRMDAREKAARLDLVAFQAGEIESAAPHAGEDDALASAKQVLANADRLLRLCEEGYAALYESDHAVLSTLSGVWKRVGELAAIDPQFVAFADARDDIKSQLEDLAFFLRRYADGVEASPARLQQVEDRLALLDRLKRKYGPTLQDVIDRGAALTRERDWLSGADAETAHLQADLDAATALYLEAARDLSARRRSAALEFSRRLVTLLGGLAMDHTRFEVRFNSQELPPDAWGERGVDEAEFFLSPNPGEDLRPLARIVSGGELSRVMLALKTLAVETGSSPSSAANSPQSVPRTTLIFDEVDAGIGGRVADVVGARLRALGDRFQVLCITHLPQIAACAATQFRIDKTVKGSRTVTSIARLDEGARVEEIARMMGGAAMTESVKASARDLLLGSIHPNNGLAQSRPSRRRIRGAKDESNAKGESES